MIYLLASIVLEFLFKGVLAALLRGTKGVFFGNCVVGERDKKSMQGE